MTAQDTLFSNIDKVNDFCFDEHVAHVFDDMVSRSVPFYQEIQRIQAELIINFLPEDNALVCDLGCSTGTSLAYLTEHPRCPPKAHFFGIDNAQAMLAKAELKLAAQISQGRVSLECADLQKLTQLPKCDVVILNWALQFVRPIEREQLLITLFNALKPKGLLLLSEKILVEDALLNRLFIDHYLHFKTSQSGYTDTENQRKREALENVLIPYRRDENYQLLARAGFQHCETYFQWFNFVCMLAVKE